MLQWWGNDRAVQSQRYLPLAHRHLTSPPFHHNPLTLTIVCLSMHRHSIANPLQCYLNRTIQLSAHFTWRFDCERSVVMLPTLQQDYKCAAVKKLCSMAASDFKFWKPLQRTKAGLRAWRWNYEWWQWYWYNLRICQFLLFVTLHSSAFIQCERGIKATSWIVWKPAQSRWTGSYRHWKHCLWILTSENS